MYQKAKRMFSFDSERKNDSHSLPKSGRRKEEAVYTDESEDAPMRFSYVRTPNSLRGYNAMPKRANSAGESSLGSSREDLLDVPLVLARRKRPNVSKQPSREYKNGNSSSEDFLYYDSDYTEEPLSTAVVETEGSVFSSQENLSDSAPKCSENVSKFLRRQSTPDIKSRRTSGSQASLNNPLVLENSVEFHQFQDKGKDKLDHFMPVCPTKNEKRNYGSSNHLQEILEPSSTADEGIVSESSLCPIIQPVLSDNMWPIMYRVQMAVTKTIRRLADHIETVKDHVDILEKKCNNLKVTLFYLQEDHNALKVKIIKLEELIEERGGKQSESDDDEYLDCIDFIPVQNVNAESLPTVEHTFENSTVGKAFGGTTSIHLSAADPSASSVDCAQDNKLFSAVFSSVYSVADQISALLNQMKTVKEKSHRPSLFNFVAVLTLTAVVWDIRSAGSFKGSKLGQTIEGLGLTPYLQVAGEYARAAFIHIYRWCMTNVPVYYSRGCELAGPYLLLMLEKLDWVLASCWTAMDSAAQYIPPLKEKIETMLPGVTSNASYYGSVALQSLENGFYYVQNASSPYLAQAHTFLSTRVFVGPLAPEKLQEYVFSAAEYISQLYKQLQSIIVQALEEANNATKATS
ncbi:uncharacterized protein LOC126986825 isoform X1 [Eriocheir sinensis]|uniref:uncharacterized protein LOC126986825 isoform X1 n=1 Tax=Eriocheir sinensis TaxID=95602 RepID=UPI0021C7110C|nr:uncharacterized protein LOC126986825 isoform X1 [Eriocheir sinensis]